MEIVERDHGFTGEEVWDRIEPIIEAVQAANERGEETVTLPAIDAAQFIIFFEHLLITHDKTLTGMQRLINHEFSDDEDDDA